MFSILALLTGLVIYNIPVRAAVDATLIVDSAVDSRATGDPGLGSFTSALADDRKVTPDHNTEPTTDHLYSKRRNS